MPLAFESESHGTIAFGFFNIYSDLLLLDHYFIFATDFCEAICQFISSKQKEIIVPAYIIEDITKIGDLHGAISGMRYTGFIGETYKAFPFPNDNNDFKQQTDGYINKVVFEKMILKFGSCAVIGLQRNINNQEVTIGPFIFSQENFSRLIEYVIRGGYPQWLDSIAPYYVLKMKESIS
ncbi:MAG: hypothetical protein GY829_03645 [Gammaproteobacteria bacterium]|nr:hypothetical protein [Gammaproteobacteria bacterium]